MNIIKIDLKGKSKEFIEGYVAGLKAFAWWKDGEQFVGTSGLSLKEAVEGVKEVTGYVDL